MKQPEIYQSPKTKCLLFFVPLLLLGCGSKLSPTDYFNYYNSFQSGSFVEVVDGEYVYQLQYRPTDYQAINALKGTGQISREMVDEQVDSFGDQNLYCLRIKLNKKGEDILKYNQKGPEDYYRRLNLLNAEFGQITYGVSDKDTVQTGFFHFERTYQIRPFIQVLFSINSEKEGSLDQIVFEDFVFRDGKKVVFDGVNKYQKNLPKLEL